jgi:hypothetical protein
MAVVVPIVTTFNAKGINKAIADFKRLESNGQKAAFAMRGVDQAAIGTAKAFAKIGAVGAVAVGIIGRPLINAASSLEESMSKVNVVFGTGAQKVKDFASTSSTALGLSRQQALEAAGTYGNLFQAFGTGQAQAAEMSTQLVALAADLASFNNTSVDDALIALRSGLSGEAEPLKRYGIAINDVRLKEEARNLGLYEGKGVLDVTAKSQAAFALIMKDSSLAQGDFARTSDGVANQQRIMAAQFKDVQASLGTALLPMFKTVLTFLNERFMPAFKIIADTFATDGLAAGVTATKDAFFGFTEGLGKTGTALMFIVGAIGALRLATIAYNIVMGVSAAVLPVFMKSLQGATVAQTQLNVAMFANPIGLIVAAVIAFIGVMALLYMRFEIVRKAVGFLGDAFMFLVKNVIALVANYFITFINLAITGFNALIKVANFFGADLQEQEKLGYMAFSPLIDGASKATVAVGKTQEALRAVRNEERLMIGKSLLPPVEDNKPPGGGGVAKTIETAKQKLEKYTSALEKVQGSTERLKGANKSLVASQRRVAEATKQVEEAQNNLTESVEAVTKAETELERVRMGLGVGSDESKKAARDVADAQRGLEDAGYSVEDAQFALIDAEEELKALREDAEASTRDLREAEINLARAKLSLTEAGLKQSDQTVLLSDLQKEFNEVTNGAGEGTERYTEAMDALTEAKKANEEASKALEDAKQNEIEANENVQKSVEDLTKAQWDLFDAEKALAELRNTTPAGVVTRAEEEVAKRESAPVASGLPFKSFMDAVRAVHPNSPTLGSQNALSASKTRFPVLYKQYEKAGLAFAKGGIVTSPTIGLIGEAGAEAIIPLSQMQSGTTINLTINAGMGADGSQIGNEIVDALKKYQRRNGSIPITVSG